jgi:integrase
VLHVRRVNDGTPSTHPLIGDEMRALRRLQRESEPSPFVFVSGRGSPFTMAGFTRVIERAATGVGLDLKAHPPMLRHACGTPLGAEPVQGLLARQMQSVMPWLRRCEVRFRLYIASVQRYDGRRFRTQGPLERWRQM